MWLWTSLREGAHFGLPSAHEVPRGVVVENNCPGTVATARALDCVASGLDLQVEHWGPVHRRCPWLGACGPNSTVLNKVRVHGGQLGLWQPRRHRIHCDQGYTGMLLRSRGGVAANSRFRPPG